MLDSDNAGLSERQNSEDSQACCPPTSGGETCCSSDSRGIPRKWRAVMVCVILAAAGVVLAHSLIKKSRTAAEHALWAPELDSLAALDEVAGDVEAVFILISSQDRPDTQAIMSEVEGATKKIRSRGKKVSAFKLNSDAVDYENLAEQFSVPTVLAMVKGLGYSAVSEQITEANLLEAFVKASRAPSACCPAGTDPSQCGSAGCGPSGCALSDSK